MKDTQKYIIVKGAKENNLKNIDIDIPKNKLVVLTGVSGSGKSSLAFATIYEEGRRRYVDSLSSYARQFLGNTKKPDVDSIDGLSPAISIEQKTTHNNPRSTVGTVTEVYDYLRLLFARIGKPFCPKHKLEITAQRSKDIINAILKNKLETKLIILSPIVRKEKGSHHNLFEKLRKDGFLRVNVNEDILSLDDEIILSKTKKHNIDIVVDRIVLKEDSRSRIAEAVELALEYGNGIVEVKNVDLNETHSYSRNHSCKRGDFDMPLIEPRLFSFNSPAGMCNECKGLGIKLKADHRIVMPNKALSINQGGVDFFKNLIGSGNLEWQKFEKLLNHYKIDLNTRLEDLEKNEIDIIMNGSLDRIEFVLNSRGGKRYEIYDYIDGVGSLIERRYLETASEQIRAWYKKYMSDVKCISCKGQRLNRYALAVQVNGINIHDFTKQAIDVSLDWVINLKLNDEEKKIANLIISELLHRLSFLNDVGLDYLSLDRKAETLSGGEAQRIRLATQIGSNLTGVLYVLDEPSIGLHQKDNAKLIKSLKHMVEIGNTLLVVEHDEETIRAADHVIDIGPYAGEAGGRIIAQGTPKEIALVKESITGQFLSGKQKIEVPKNRRGGNDRFLKIIGAKENNLNNLNVTFPLNKLIAVTGVSGSGKSSLVNEVLCKGIQKYLTKDNLITGDFKEIKGLNHIDKLVKISQSPIGRTPRSNPATYTSVFDDIRTVFANSTESKARGYLKGRFSFNVDGGRCDKCRGDGSIKIEMHFLPDVYVECDHCDGTRYNNETLEVKFKNKNIANVLSMSVDEALAFFVNNPKIRNKLQTLVDVGLGYIKLGQSATTLSGGEAQRVKLATFLQKRPTGKTLYVLDEPTTGLHAYDVKKLISVLERIVNGGDTVIVIEHNLDVIKVCDYIIDLGPGGGVNGGKIVASGTPEQVANITSSYTGEYLKGVLNEK